MTLYPPNDLDILREEAKREMAVIMEAPRLVGDTLARCVQCETPTHDATTCTACVDHGDPCPYCRSCVRQCVECNEPTCFDCFEHRGHRSDRCVTCIRHDEKLSGDQA